MSIPNVAQEAWTAESACRTLGPDLFHPGPGETTAAAKAICATCPVTAACEDYADRYSIRYGVWGGKAPDERHPAPPGPPPIKHGTVSGYRTHHRRGESPCVSCRIAQQDAKAEYRARRAVRQATA